MQVIGIDISKSWFDVHVHTSGRKARFDNTIEGWKAFKGWSAAPFHAVMEASGSYYLGLACWLSEQGEAVSVVNPLVIRRYSQMKFIRAKTDAKDAALIAEYAVINTPDRWTPPAPYIRQLRQLLACQRQIVHMRTQVRNQAEAFAQDPGADEWQRWFTETQLKGLASQLEQVEARIQALAKRYYSSTLKGLRSIPGIGPKTAMLLTVLTDNFTRFEDSRQLCGYIGLCPRIYESGSSVRGKGAICKVGPSEIRQMLYMCAWSARKYNKACMKLYERMAAKGKPAKVITIALAHKLLRQAFYVGKHGVSYDEKKALGT
jgi:transposase